MSKPRFAVIGSGSWGTALVKLLSNNAETVKWYVRNPEHIEHIKKFHHNPRYLSAVDFNVDKLDISNDAEDIIKNSDVIILAVPSAFLDGVLKKIDKSVFENKLFFSAIKGIVPEHLLIVGEYLQKIYSVPLSNIGVITGPCHAEEVALEKLSYLTVACSQQDNAQIMADALKCRYIKLSTSDDIYGTEYSAVLKNVMAIASGICHGIGYGDNFQAVLISNAIQEIARFVKAVHPINRDINASAYLGDLLVTAYSQFSRNRMFGTMLGKGYSVKMAQLEMNMIAEGYYGVKCIEEINKQYQVDMPISKAVYNIIYGKVAPVIEMRLLSDKFS
jgi:glycerol-3-phosphate dehydrogenase (NAD(P)+)